MVTGRILFLQASPDFAPAHHVIGAVVCRAPRERLWLPLRPDSVLDDGAVGDEEGEHENRQCRNWPDHAAVIDTRGHPAIPGSGRGESAFDSSSEEEPSEGGIHLSGGCPTARVFRM